MAYPKGHKEQVRLQIVRAARKLFNRHGFEAVSINQVTAAAGLTRGAFYFHFASKAELYREAIAFVLVEHPAQKWMSGDPSLSPVQRIINAYLGDRHRTEIEESCPLVTQASEAGRMGPEAREVVRSVVLALVEALSSDRENNSGPSPEALVLASLCVGGQSLARSLGDDPLADRILEACRSAAQDMIRRQFIDRTPTG